MAITYIGGHDTDNFTPAFNQVNYYFDSTNKNQAGFRYVVDLYLSGTATKIWEGRIAPRIGDGYGFIPLMGILSKQVSYETDVTLTASNAVNSWFKFDLKIGEEFVTNYQMDISESRFPNGLYTIYTMAVSSVFIVGDQVEVHDTAGGVVGLFTVLEVSTTEVTVDLIWDGNVVTQVGYIVYADSRKTITRDLSTHTATVYNGALSNIDFITLSNSLFKIAGASATNRLLTNLPSTGFRITDTQDLWVNVGNFYLTTAYYMYFQNDAGDTLRKKLGSSTSSPIRQVSVGAGNLGSLSVVSGTAPLIKDDTTKYVFWVTDSAGVQLSKGYIIDIDRRCLISGIEVVFLDRMGSLSSFAFQLRNQKSVSVKRESFTKSLGEVSSGKWRYTNVDGGKTTTGIAMDEDYTIRTNWITDEQSVYFEELVTSPFVLMKLNEVYYRVEVLDNSVVVERTLDKSMIKKQLSIRMANQTNINI